MVDIRDAFAAATSAGAVDVALAARLTALAKQLHYPERSLRGVLSRARAQGEDREAIDA